jgi:hypothetical protein
VTDTLSYQELSFYSDDEVKTGITAGSKNDEDSNVTEYVSARHQYDYSLIESAMKKVNDLVRTCDTLNSSYCLHIFMHVPNFKSGRTYALGKFMAGFVFRIAYRIMCLHLLLTKECCLSFHLS